MKQLQMYAKVAAGKYVALCRGHTDAWAYRGHYHPDTKEVLTFFISCAQPAYVLVFLSDLFKPWGQKLAQAGLPPAKLFKVYDGESIVMEGAAGQTCCHIVFGPVDSICIRVRTFLVPE